MARVTVEDCLQKIPNRFELVMVATRRARQLATGAEPLVPWENDKPTVVALREIAAGHIDLPRTQYEEDPDELAESMLAANSILEMDGGVAEPESTEPPEDPEANPEPSAAANADSAPAPAIEADADSAMDEGTDPNAPQDDDTPAP